MDAMRVWRMGDGVVWGCVVWEEVLGQQMVVLHTAILLVLGHAICESDPVPLPLPLPLPCSAHPSTPPSPTSARVPLTTTVSLLCS